MYNSSNNINTLGEFCMIRLSANFSDEEKEVLSKYTGNNFELLSHIEGGDEKLLNGVLQAEWHSFEEFLIAYFGLLC